jgi:hypothetical protein
MRLFTNEAFSPNLALKQDPDPKEQGSFGAIAWQDPRIFKRLILAL